MLKKTRITVKLNIAFAMIRCISLFLAIGFFIKGFATPQQPDQLVYNNLSLNLSTGWGHPSPLETFYYQTNTKYPFESLSTANYRGHIATWVIQNDRFYLKEIDVAGQKSTPQKYGIKSQFQDTSQLTFADWFSGILSCIKFNKKENTTSRYYFEIQNGNVKSVEEVTEDDFYSIENLSVENTDSPGLITKKRLILLNLNYVAYYYRLNVKDEIEYDNKPCRLSTSSSKLSPIYGLYSFDHLKWPYNWLNVSKSGIPHCKWKIVNDSLQLISVELYSGLRFDSIYKEDLALDSLMPGRTSTQHGIFADWFTGVQLIVYGVSSNHNSGFKEFKPKEFTYCRIVRGIVTEAYTIPSSYNLNKKKKTLNSKLQKLIADY